MNCPHCQHETRIMFQLYVSCPSSWEGQLTKKRIASKECLIWGANWGAADHVCNNCGYVSQGLKNYIQQLEEKLRHYESKS